jgi:hypothetical protein
MLSIGIAGCAHAGVGQAPGKPSEEWGAPELAFSAIACWLGPVSQEAPGDPVAVRVAKADVQCHFTVQHTWGNRDDEGDYERLRALEENAVADLLTRVGALAQRAGEGDRHELVMLLKATATAERDNLWARRAADKVKLDLTGARMKPDASLTDDERAALGPFARAGSLRALLELRVGALAPDARALGILCAMDRIEIARGLPRRLEIAAAAPALQLLFGASPPAVPSDVGVEVAPHVWIDYLVRAANTAGHPISPTAVGGEERDRLAWAAVLDGLADRLATVGTLGAPLRAVVDGAERRLRAEAIGDRNWFAGQHASSSETSAQSISH